MSRQADVEVQHWVRAAQIQQVTGRPEFNLFEVALDFSVPPDTEFPRVVPHWDMFLRVVGRNAGETRVLVRVHHEVRPGRWELRNEYENTRHRLTLPPDRTAIHDRPIRLANVSLGGTGLHAITIYFRPVDESDADDEYLWDRDETPWDPDEPEWSFGAVEYLRVRRPT
jgi:hypothetical protein